MSEKIELLPPTPGVDSRRHGNAGMSLGRHRKPRKSLYLSGFGDLEAEFKQCVEDEGWAHPTKVLFKIMERNLKKNTAESDKISMLAAVKLLEMRRSLMPVKPDGVGAQSGLPLRWDNGQPSE